MESKAVRRNASLPDDLIMEVLIMSDHKTIADGNSFLRVPLKTGKLSYFPPVSSFCPGEVVKVHGIDNGNMCLTLELSRSCERLVVWNMFTRSTREIPEFPPFSYKTFRNEFAFTYLPASVNYCIVHTFKVRFGENLLMYNIYYSETNKWLRTFRSEGNVGNIDSHYVAMEGVIYWLNYQDGQYHIPNSIVACSAMTRGIEVYSIPDKCKSGKLKLISFNKRVCLACYSLGQDHYTLSVWELKRAGENVGMIDEDQQDGQQLQYLILRRFPLDEQRQRITLICQDWKQDVEVGYMQEYAPSLYPA
ncbi:hypothetical protein PIB30_052481 [Stylosanthes scabra]|uniref:F-box associated beta-propeller type 1 domain-containing protein n=1 Tax=Stylosanthes scabra TaxID=79078 RepID=A0ABU6SJD1_9FABA|nr:hypothetical protein [Stylosanthes scabra]